MSEPFDLAQEFNQLSGDDQELVIALINRLRQDEAPVAVYPRDVSFMDFDE